MKAGDTAKRDAIRLIQAALKNRDIELRGSANPPDDDVLVTADGGATARVSGDASEDELQAAYAVAMHTVEATIDQLCDVTLRIVEGSSNEYVDPVACLDVLVEFGFLDPFSAAGHA